MEQSKSTVSRLTAYTLFSRHVYKDMQHHYPGCTFVEYSRIMAEMWSELPSGDKVRFKHAAKRYNLEKKNPDNSVNSPVIPTVKFHRNLPEKVNNEVAVMETCKTDAAKGVSKPASSDTSVQLNNTNVTAVGTPFPVTLIRVDRKPQPMTYQFADKTDMLSMCKSGAKSNVKVVYTCTPVNSQQKVKASVIKKEAAANPICTTGIAPIQSGIQRSKNLQPVIKTETSGVDILPIHPDPSLVKVEPLDDVVVIENEDICRKEIKTEPSWNSDITQQKSLTRATPAASSVATLQCTSPQTGTLSPPVLKSISPLSAVQRHDTPPVLTIEPELPPLNPMKTPANSTTASAILKQKIASFVASNRSYMDVSNKMPTKLTIQGKTIVPAALSSYKTPPTTSAYQNQDVDEKPNDGVCAVTTSTASEPPVRVAFKPKRQGHGNKKRKKEREEVPIYTCNQCMIAFSQDSQLKAHFLSAHTEEEEGNCPSFKCHFCNILFLGKGDLTTHLVKHHASKGVVSLHPSASPDLRQPKYQPTPQEEPHQNITASQHKSIICQLQSHQSAQPTVQNIAVTAVVGPSEKRQKLEKDRLSPLKASNAESCKLCGCLFPYKRSLDIHRLKEHVNIFSPTSSVSLDRSETVNLEIEGQNGSSYVQQNVVHKTSFCLSCGYPCKSNSELGKHIYSKHGGKYFCPASGCDRIYHERRCLKLHINSHHPKFRAYSCKSCSYCTYQQLAILRHLDSHVKETDTIDLSVDDQEADSDSNSVAEEESGPAGDDQNKSEGEEESVDMDTEETSAPYVYIERFNGEEVVDVPFNQPAEAPPSPPPAKVPKQIPKASSKPGKSSKAKSQSGFRCLDCKGYFLERSTLTAHFSSCGSNASTNKGKLEQSFPTDPMIRTCNLCFQNFKSFAALKSHRRHMHFNHAAEDNKFSCFTCGRSFLNSRGLSSHMKLHVNDNQEAE